MGVPSLNDSTGKSPKPIKLKIKSPTVERFQPMLQALAAKDELNEVIKNRVEKGVQLLDDGIPLFPNDRKKDADVQFILDTYRNVPQEELEQLDKSFAVAGRIVSLRSFGKAAFFHLQDSTGRIQIHIARDELGEAVYNVFKKLDVGDIVWIRGGLFRTKTDELTLKTVELALLTKSMRPLPEKYHGLTNVEIRYRQRYVDLIVTPRAADIFRKRTRLISEMRRFLDAKGFMEVETPILQSIPGGATARPFITHHNTLDMQLYMRIAPELYLKRLLVGGFEKVYEIGRQFRNEGISTQHNPEFTMCEFYWAYATFHELMDLTEELYSHLAETVCGSSKITYQGQEIDLTCGTWQRLTFLV